jgi:quercetin dioxygenase-like cupin family protein
VLLLEVTMTDLIVKLADEVTWRPTGQPGIEWAALHRDGLRGATGLLRLAKGARYPADLCPGGEEIFVVKGDMRVGVSRLRAGDFLVTPPGGSPDGQAMLDSVLLVTMPARAA